MPLLTVRSLTSEVITSPSNLSLLVSAGSAKRGVTRAYGVRFRDEAGAIAALAAGAVITLGLKLPNPANNGVTAYDGPYAVAGTTSEPADADGVYWINLLFESPALNQALRYNPPNANDDIASVDLEGEIAWTVGGKTDKSTSFALTVNHDVNQGSEIPLTNPTTVYRGTVEIPSGVDAIQISDLAMPGVPVDLLLTVRKPTMDGYNLYATAREDSLSTDGLIVDLSAATDGAGYKLTYLLFL